MNTTEKIRRHGFAILIKARGAFRRFTPGEGETIVVPDKNDKELWSIKIPGPMGNPGIISHEVQIDLLTEREFGHFCQNTWTTGRPSPACPSQVPRQQTPVNPPRGTKSPIALQQR